MLRIIKTGKNLMNSTSAKKALFSYFSWTCGTELWKLKTNKEVIFDLFHATGLFLYPLETSRNLWFLDIFKGYRKRSVV